MLRLPRRCVPNLLVFKTLNKFKIEEAKVSVCVCLCVCVCVSLCVSVSVSVSVSLSLGSNSSETVEVIINTLGMLTASDVVDAWRGNYIDLDLHSRSHGS